MLRVSLERFNLPSSVAKRMLGSDMVLDIPNRHRQLVGTELRGGHDIGNGSTGSIPARASTHSTSSAPYLRGNLRYTARTSLDGESQVVKGNSYASVGGTGESEICRVCCGGRWSGKLGKRRHMGNVSLTHSESL